MDKSDDILSNKKLSTTFQRKLFKENLHLATF